MKYCKNSSLLRGKFLKYTQKNSITLRKNSKLNTTKFLMWLDGHKQILGFVVKNSPQPAFGCTNTGKIRFWHFKLKTHIFFRFPSKLKGNTQNSWKNPKNSRNKLKTQGSVSRHLWSQLIMAKCTKKSLLYSSQIVCLFPSHKIF